MIEQAPFDDFIDQKILVIAGVTAAGKSDIALDIARTVNGFIINADSQQIYKELSVGTAKPVPDEVISDTQWKISGVDHYLYGHRSIYEKERYSIYDYQLEVAKILRENVERKPILVGGTGLYIDSVVFNYNLSADGKSNTKGSALKHSYVVISPPVEVLRERVIRRVEIMFENGLVEEALGVKDKILDEKRPLKVLGYSEFGPYFRDEKGYSLDLVKSDIITSTMQYAKRQRTWFRKHGDQAHWFEDSASASQWIQTHYQGVGL